MKTIPATTLPSIETCTHGHCCFHFPQFTRLNPIKWRESLAKYLANVSPENRELFLKAITLLDLRTHEGIFRACEIAGKSWGYDLYVDKRGEVAIFEPCCK